MTFFEQTRQIYKEDIKSLISYSTKRRVDILSSFVKNKDVLDVGCVEHNPQFEELKEWYLHPLLKKQARSIVGIDNDKKGILALQSMGYNVRVRDAENFSFARQFDVIIAGELFEHLVDRKGFLNSCHKCLRSSGKLIMSMPNANSLNYFIQTLVYEHEVDAWDHTAFFTPVTLFVMMRKCGWVVERIILYQPTEIYHHEKRTHRIMALSFNLIQQCICWLFPQLSRGLIAVCTPKVKV